MEIKSKSHYSIMRKPISLLRICFTNKCPFPKNIIFGVFKFFFRNKNRFNFFNFFFKTF